MKKYLAKYRIKFLKDPLLFVRENLSLLIGLPALLGGIWQLVELSSISFSYVRFFSISQILPDGLIIIIVFLLLFSTLYLYIKFFIPDEDEEKVILIRDDENILVFKVKSFFLIFLYLALIIGFLYILYIYPVTGILALIGNLISFIAVIKVSSVIFQYVSNPIKTKHSESIRSMMILLILPLGYTIYTMIAGFHNVYILAKDLVNVENIKCHIESDKKQNIKFEIRYLNDKYIFLEITEYKLDVDKSDTIFHQSRSQIISFESLLDEEPCRVLKKAEEMKQENLKKEIRDLELKMERNIIRLDSFTKAEANKKRIHK